MNLFALKLGRFDLRCGSASPLNNNELALAGEVGQNIFDLGLLPHTSGMTLWSAC